MEIDSTGRKAVVTGSTAGIGRAIAEGLARAGASVVINGRREDRVAATLRELHALFPKGEFVGVVADLATPEGAAELFARVPDADILVNNVGTGRPKPFFDIADKENSVLPGPTNSEIMSGWMKAAAEAQGITQEEAEQQFLKTLRPTTLLNRFTTTEEVANLVVYVCSEQASGTTGTSLRVDGGVVRTIA
ncbi:SDR family oxidoreductase [Mesorhizobium australicum]|uniref:SDR family NAD(P)-dependent oxidoreductase n=1 Tax=Mesorhizobium australicum TaxID=536018 RepID=UPI00333CB8E5